MFDVQSIHCSCLLKFHKRDKGQIMSIVAITGAGGYIARQLIAALENQQWCHRILGTDIVEPGFQSTKLKFRHQDVRDPLLFKFDVI